MTADGLGGVASKLGPLSSQLRLSGTDRRETSGAVV